MKRSALQNFDAFGRQHAEPRCASAQRACKSLMISPSRKQRWMTLALLVCLTAGAAWADTLVVPLGLEETEGNTYSSYPFETYVLDTTYARRLQMFDPSFFEAYPDGMVITGIAFRRDGGPLRGSVDAFYPEVEVRLSTSPRLPSEGTRWFEDNIGPDETLVFDGPVSWKTPYTPGQVHPFDLRMPFDRPFTYIPGQGSLAIDIIVHGKARDTAPVDGESSFRRTMFSVWAGREVAWGQSNFKAMVTELTFEPIPEPGTMALALMGAGLVVLLKWRKQ